MKTQQSVAVLVAIATSIALLPASAQDAKADLVSLTLTKKPTEAQQSVLNGSRMGVMLQMSITIPGRTIVGFERDSCTLEKFTDDKGTNLFAALGRAPKTSDWTNSFGPQISEDGKICLIIIESPGLPAKEASRILFSGAVALRAGAGNKTAEQKSVAIKKGTKITAGPLPLEISVVTTTATETTLDFKATQPMDRIISIKFFDAAGKEIKSSRQGSSTMRFLGNYEAVWTYSIARKVTAATVKIAYFEKIETVSVPIKVDAGVGF